MVAVDRPVSCAELRALYADHTIGAIAAHLGVSSTTIWRWLNSYGIERRTRGNYSRNPGSKIVRALYEAGRTPREIAARYAVKPKTAVSWIIASGATIRPGPGNRIDR